MRVCIPIALAFMLAGCAGLDFSALGEIGLNPEKAKEIEDKTLGNAVKPLPVYCKAPSSARALIRARINARPEAEGAQIGVWCPGDSPLTLGTP